MKAGFLSGGASHNSSLCPHTSRPPADSTGRSPVTQGSPHPTFFPSRSSQGRVRTGRHQATRLSSAASRRKTRGCSHPRGQRATGGKVQCGGVRGERSRRKRQESRLQAGETVSDPSPWLPLVNHQEVFWGQSPHSGKEIQLFACRGSCGTPGQSSHSGHGGLLRVFNSIQRKTRTCQEAERAEQWML